MSRDEIETDITSKWTRRLVVFIGLAGGVAVIFLVFTWFFGTQTACVLQTRRWARQTPIMNTVPVELANLAVSAAPERDCLLKGLISKFPGTTSTKRRLKLLASASAFISGLVVRCYSASLHLTPL